MVYDDHILDMVERKIEVFMDDFCNAPKYTLVVLNIIRVLQVHFEKNFAIIILLCEKFSKP